MEAGRKGGRISAERPPEARKEAARKAARTRAERYGAPAGHASILLPVASAAGFPYALSCLMAVHPEQTLAAARAYAMSNALLRCLDC